MLPITPPLDQGDSDLCWVYATLSMLETNYLYRHPGSKISLSRGALQRDSIADRFARLIRGERGPLEDGGLAVEALALIRQDGLVARGDFHHVVDSGPIYASSNAGSPATRVRADKLRALDRQLKARLGREPPITHLDGEALEPWANWPKPCSADISGPNSIARATASEAGALRTTPTPAPTLASFMSGSAG